MSLPIEHMPSDVVVRIGSMLGYGAFTLLQQVAGQTAVRLRDSLLMLTQNPCQNLRFRAMPSVVPLLNLMGTFGAAEVAVVDSEEAEQACHILQRLPHTVVEVTVDAARAILEPRELRAMLLSIPPSDVRVARVRGVVNNSNAAWRVMDCSHLRERVYDLYEINVEVNTLGFWSFGLLLNLFNSLPHDGGSVILRVQASFLDRGSWIQCFIALRRYIAETSVVRLTCAITSVVYRPTRSILKRQVRLCRDAIARSTVQEFSLIHNFVVQV
jgi:hypothetical protein